MKKRFRTKVFDVYTEDEAIKLGIEYSQDWRNAQPGDWIVMYSGEVVKVTKRTHQSNNGVKKAVTFIHTGYGAVPTYKKHISPSISKNRSDEIYSDDGIFSYSNDVKPTVKQLLFAENLLKFGDIDERGMWTTDSVLNAYQSVFKDNNPTQSLWRGLKILKKKRVEKYMMEQMKDILDTKGLNDDWVAEKLKSLSGGDTPAATKLNAVNRVSELRGHNLKETNAHEKSFTVQIAPAELKKLKERREKHAELLSADDEILEAVFLEVEKRRKLSEGKNTEAQDS
jgi:hypothetical protein|tara:strand:+ start:255 stop:1103 length:849 start_codon:yes stop_codon:yes gene_type:complete